MFSRVRHGPGDASIGLRGKSFIRMLTGYAFMAFVLLYMPCVVVASPCATS
jgi:hypothetical protein